jgi:hypothetical protein
LVWVSVAGPLAIGQERPSGFRFGPINESALGLWEGSKPVLVYNHQVPTRTEAPFVAARNSYIHPLYGLDGEVLTDDAPADHLHHRGVFWAWPHIRIDGKEYDLWVLKGIEPRFERWGDREAGPKKAVLEVENGWYTGERKVMKELVRIEVQPASDEGRAIDLDLTWTPTDRPITLVGAPGKSYGGLSLRFAPGEETTITVPSGRTTDDLLVAHLPWADLTRLWNGKRTHSGATILVHPDHPDFPPTWMTRHYGILCVGWPGIEAKTLESGRSVRCRYRIWVHRDRPDTDHLRRIDADYRAAAPRAGGTDPSQASP